LQFFFGNKLSSRQTGYNLVAPLLLLFGNKLSSRQTGYTLVAPLLLLFGNKLSSRQTSYTLVDLAYSFSLIPSLFHTERGPSPQLILDLAHLAIMARVGYFMARIGFFMARMRLFVCPLALLDQLLDPVEPWVSAVAASAHSDLLILSNSSLLTQL
jgi:hypothetical protein